MSTTTKWAWTCGFALALLACTRIAHAGEVRSVDDGTGIPLGAFLLSPSLGVTTSFDDNVRRTQTLKRADAILTFSPAVALRSRWARHALNLLAASETRLYARYSSENITSFNVGGDGVIDVLRSLRISGRGTFARLYEPRSSPELPTDAEKPLTYTRAGTDVSVEYQPARLGFQIGIGFDRLRYDSLETVGGGDISWSDQNRDIITPHARVFYEFLPDYQAYLETSYDDRDFELPIDRDGFHRSSNGYRVRGGFEALLGNLLQGNFFLGYLDQNYSEPLEDVRGLDFGASLDWSVTPLTTLHVTAARTINDTTFAGVSGVDDQAIGLSVDHALLRELVLNASINFVDSQYRGSSRSDQLVALGAGAEYRLNRFLSLAARYIYQHRTSKETAQGYVSNVFSIGITGRL